MTTIYAVVCSANPDIHHTKFYCNMAGAKHNLKEIVDSRRNKLGVQVIEDTETKFAYLLGWEEHCVSFSIIEIALQPEILESY